MQVPCRSGNFGIFFSAVPGQIDELRRVSTEEGSEGKPLPLAAEYT